MCAHYFGIYEVIKTSQNRNSANNDGNKATKQGRQFWRIDHTGINQARMVTRNPFHHRKDGLSRLAGCDR